ncbi:MAG: hypothetical protein GX547_07600 [Phycisphaerae bacterium]|nr:hypothetical protein [Phycisphaerae bacterium]
MERPTLSFLCETVSADTRIPFPGDPRNIANRAVAYMRSTGLADEAWMAPEFEFHVFERVKVKNSPYDMSVHIVSNEIETDGSTPLIPAKQGYLRTPPSDRLHSLRTEIVLTLGELGVPIRYHHHEVGAPGQCEVEVELAPLLVAADRAMLIKYVIKNVAAATASSRPSCPSRSLARPVTACTCTRSSNPPGSPFSMTKQAATTPASATWRCTTRPVCSSTGGLWPGLPTRPRTRTSGWWKGTRRPSIFSFRWRTARPRFACRAMPSRRRPSGSSTARPISRETCT